MIGELFAGRYRVVSSLGHGAMGAVWLADDEVLGRQVAINQLRVDPTRGIDAEDVARMQREARTAAQLHHRNIVTVFDLVHVDEQPYVIMEYVAGESLAERIRREGRLPLDDATRIGAEIASALALAHRRGVVHRDVKPANILLSPEDGAKLADFGIARSLGDVALTQTGHMIGTIAYMAPEVARTGQATSASDVYSLGATLFAAIEGRAPFDDGSKPNTTQLLIRLVTESAPKSEAAGELSDLIADMLATGASDRPSIEQVANDLDARLQTRERVKDATAVLYRSRDTEFENVGPSEQRSSDPIVPEAPHYDSAPPTRRRSDFESRVTAEATPAYVVTSDDSTRQRGTERAQTPIVDVNPRASKRRKERRPKSVAMAAIAAAALVGGLIVVVSMASWSSSSAPSAGAASPVPVTSERTSSAQPSLESSSSTPANTATRAKVQECSNFLLARDADRLPTIVALRATVARGTLTVTARTTRALSRGESLDVAVGDSRARRDNYPGSAYHGVTHVVSVVLWDHDASAWSYAVSKIPKYPCGTSDALRSISGEAHGSYYRVSASLNTISPYYRIHRGDMLMIGAATIYSNYSGNYVATVRERIGRPPLAVRVT